MYCPTTCGVSDYMFNYITKTNSHLDQMLDDLETIANVTQDAEETVVYMKDSMVAAQKSNNPGNTPNMDPLKISHLVCTDLNCSHHFFFFFRRHLFQKVIKHAG